jgi:hypothetical protein
VSSQQDPGKAACARAIEYIGAKRGITVAASCWSVPLIGIQAGGVMRRVVLIFAVVMAMGAARAEALSVRDIIELSKTGLSDDVLIALIEVERQVFPVDTATLKSLKESGVSEKVMLAMVRSGRTQPPPAPQPVAPAVLEEPGVPQRAARPASVVVVEHHDVSVVREMPVAVPVYVPVMYVPHAPRHARPAQPIDAFVPPASTIGLGHSRLGLSPAPARPTSDPPYWKQ